MANEVQVKEQGKLATYFRGVKTETKKVVWPTPKKLVSLTGIVIAVSLIITAIVYAFDLLVAFGFTKII